MGCGLATIRQREGGGGVGPQPVGALIVVADDEADIRRLVGFTLRRRGYAVLEAGDGAEALDLIRRARPDLVLLDVHMPRMDGLDVVRALAADLALPAIPIVLLSASAQLPEVEAGLAAGAAAYVIKPFVPAELVEKIAAVLAEWRTSPGQRDTSE